MTTYISGLRGKVPPSRNAEEKDSPFYELKNNRRKKEAKDFKSDFLSNTTPVYPKVGMVTLKLDL